MEWLNSVPIFHEDVIHILQPKISEFTEPYLDNIGVKGLKMIYLNEDGSPAVLNENPSIQCFIFEHLQNVN